MKTLRQLRKERGYTLAEVSRDLECCISLLSKYEIGREPISDTMRLKLEQYYGETFEVNKRDEIKMIEDLTDTVLEQTNQIQVLTDDVSRLKLITNIQSQRLLSLENTLNNLRKVLDKFRA